MTYARTLFLTLLLTGAAAIGAPRAHVVLAAQEHAEQAPRPNEVAKEAAAGEEAAGGGWLAVTAKAVNFALLAGVLVYFLRTPLNEYLAGRIAKVREDLVTAADTRERANRQLAEIQSRLNALPAELEALKARGAEEIAAERVRIEQAAEAERQRLLEQTRREIDTRVRVARRELVEQAASLAVDVAATRIKSAITPDDQARLVDRYTSQLTAQAPRGEARS